MSLLAVLKHLPGKHNQKLHGRGVGIKPAYKVGGDVSVYTIKAGESIPKELLDQIQPMDSFKFNYNPETKTWHIAAAPADLIDHAVFFNQAMEGMPGDPDLKLARGDITPKGVYLYDFRDSTSWMYEDAGERRIAKRAMGQNLKKAANNLPLLAGKLPVIEYIDF